jgi:hypothetical protein
MRVSMMFTLAAPLAVALMAAPALAHGPGGGGACGGDIKALCAKAGVAPGSGNCMSTLCPGVPPGPGAFATCIDNAASKYSYTVSANCSAQLAKMQAKIAAWQTAFNTACANDVSTFCSNVTTGPWSTAQCLRQAIMNNQAVSQPCQAFLAQHHGHRPHHAPNWAPGSGEPGTP